MFTGRSKIVKANGAEPDEFEASVAQELFNLEVMKMTRYSVTDSSNFVVIIVKPWNNNKSAIVQLHVI